MSLTIAANNDLRQFFTLQLTRECSKRTYTPGKFAACHMHDCLSPRVSAKATPGNSDFVIGSISISATAAEPDQLQKNATVCSPLAFCICMPRAHTNKYLEPDAEWGQLGVATCQQLLQACELGLLSSCAAWLLHKHTQQAMTHLATAAFSAF